MSYTNGLDDPTLYFNTVLYTGNGSTQSITGVGFQPDWVWIKDRTNANSHQLVDVVRGSDKVLVSDANYTETTDSNRVSSLDADGFSVGSNSNVNQSSANIVSWNWLAGGTASSNTDGSITSTVSANTTAGFSIVSYTGNSTAGATVGHGLGVVPSVVLVKSRDGAYGWGMYHHKNTSAPETDYLSINNSDATVDDVNFWNDTAPTSSVFSLGGTDAINKTSNGHVAYCFAEKKGFSRFGSYVGNGSSDGPMIWTGMKPAFLLIKKTSANDGWWRIQDNKREPFNVVDKSIFANVSDAEYDSANYSVDFLSNGFKIRTALTGNNQSGGTYIYMCFAENPFVTSTGIPTPAR